MVLSNELTFNRNQSFSGAGVRAMTPATVPGVWWKGELGEVARNLASLGLCGP